MASWDDVPSYESSNSYDNQNDSYSNRRQFTNSRGRGGGGGGRGFRGGGGGGGGGGYRGDRSYDSGSSKTIYVPSRLVGKVIGRGGSTITEFQQTSGANIKVTKDQQNDETAVIIRGADEQIQKAEDLINALISRD